MEIARLPFVFVIDVDGTLVGDVSSEICLSDIVSQCTTENDKCSDCVFQHIEASLSHGLARPHFVTFYKTMKDIYDECEFFIYTSATKGWTEILISIYEKHFNVEFHRPLFTRKFCDNHHKKNLELIIPSIREALVQKYPTISLYMLRRRIILVDNSMISHKFDSTYKNYIKCPTYRFQIKDDMVQWIPTLNIEKHYTTISNILNKYLGFVCSNDSYENFMKDYKQYICQNCTDTAYEKTYKKDLFWLKLACFIATYDLENALARDIIVDYEKYLLKQIVYKI